MNRVGVMRFPVLMEDEGRHVFVRSFDTREQAERRLDKNAKPFDFFKRGDYYIVP